MESCGPTADSPSIARVQSWARIASRIGAGSQVPAQREALAA
jgi:hypothetical protein